MSRASEKEMKGRRPSALTAAIQNTVASAHTLLYRATGGLIGGRVLNSPVLLLTTTGRKTGKKRTVPLLYLADKETVVLVASNGGAVKDPTWWLNLKSNPEAEVQINGRRRRVRARQASAEEKRRLWPRLTQMYPGYQKYQDKTDRDIPLVILQ